MKNTQKLLFWILPTFLVLITIFIVNIYMYVKESKVKQLELPKINSVIHLNTQTSKETKLSWCKMNYQCKVLAEAGYHEARGENDTGVVSVMYVIKNRKEDLKYFSRQKTISDVVYARHQFSYVLDGSKARGMMNRKQVDCMYMLAYDVLHNRIESPVKDSLFYHNHTVSPSWSKKLEYVSTVDNHIFYK